MKSCFIGLGGNFENTLEIMEQALLLLSQTEGIFDLIPSRLFRTSPVSDLPQPPFLNAVAKFDCSLPLLTLFNKLETLEIFLGKKKKEKNAPRLIDIDLLFYGQETFCNEKIIVPHPFWKRRLFVLAPLADLVDVIPFDPLINVQEILREFSNVNQERVSPLSHKLGRPR